MHEVADRLEVTHGCPLCWWAVARGNLMILGDFCAGDLEAHSSRNRTGCASRPSSARRIDGAVMFHGRSDLLAGRDVPQAHVRSSDQDRIPSVIAVRTSEKLKSFLSVRS